MKTSQFFLSKFKVKNPEYLIKKLWNSNFLPYFNSIQYVKLKTYEFSIITPCYEEVLGIFKKVLISNIQPNIFAVNMKKGNLRGHIVLFYFLPDMSKDTLSNSVT